MEEGRSIFKILSGIPIGKRLLRRPRCRWEDNIRMDFEEIGINMRNRVDSTQDWDYWRALVNTALNLQDSCPVFQKCNAMADFSIWFNLKFINGWRDKYTMITSVILK